MRLYEFASAQAQLALWKLISDNVWSAINQQARDETNLRAAAKSSSRPKRGASTRKAASTPIVRPFPNPLSAHTLQTSPQSIGGVQPNLAGNVGQADDALTSSIKPVSPELGSTVSNTKANSVDKDTKDQVKFTKSSSMPMTSQFGRLPVAQKR
jgi:hypothetical protein